ncbi:zinc-finger homeodomain protein 4 [Gastrolobium bilobum]|uniref:zinc-finger homeodomain protein 4 n=1 Tax=Gastrolobium bilobum TaxID=150636 RepID=UPI002AB1E345|nr:zinc-finger homeodomain protein 4 [Gastrolobium bilobum]
MELSSQEVEIPIPIPINSSSTNYGGGHGNGHGEGHGHMIHHDLPPHQNPSNGSDHGHGHGHGPGPYKKVVRYRECLKNHAAAMGGNATDGCGEFMPNGEEGTIEALNCSACHCHRNFHRKEVEGEPSSYTSQSHFSRKFILGHHHHKNILPPEALVGYPTPNILPSRSVPPHQMIFPYNIGSLPSESDELQEEHGGGTGTGTGIVARPTQLVKKRFRTKFTQEQKEKMLNFADKVGWKIQKQEESVVQQFCQEIGVKRRVLKVWMHNNKHNLAKKNHPSPI